MVSKKELTVQLFDRFSKRLAVDAGILQSYIALISALFYYDDKKLPLVFFQCSRRQLMRFSRIRSIATYHKCLSELVNYGYVEYIPSWHPIKASKFRFIKITDRENDG